MTFRTYPISVPCQRGQHRQCIGSVITTNPQGGMLARPCADHCHTYTVRPRSRVPVRAA